MTLTGLVGKWINSLSALDLLCLGGVVAATYGAAYLGMWPYSIFTMPGTLAHELAHYLTAAVLGADPSFPNLIPMRIAGGWRLGSVTCYPNLITAIPIALAPFLLAPAGLWWAAKFLPKYSGGWYLLHAWIAGTMMMASLPSRQDWRIAAPSIAIAALVYLVWRVLTRRWG